MLKSARTGAAAAGRPVRTDADDRVGAVALTGIGIGGIVGAGYFLGIGIVVHQAGPAIVLTFLLGGLILAQVMGALATMATSEPRTSYRSYVQDNLGRFAGYLLGWVVFASGILGLGSEAVAMATYARLWLGQVPPVVMAIAFSLLALGLNALGTRRVGQAESAMSVLKVALLLGFVAVGALALAGVVSHGAGRIGWPLVAGAVLPHGPGPVLGASLIAVFSYTGITAVAMAGGRARHPERDVAHAAVATVVAVVVLYLTALTILLLLVPWQSTSTAVSPFTQALRELPLPVAMPLFNALILVASFSVLSGGLYATVWMLASLAGSGEAPAVLASPGQGAPSAAPVVATGVALLLSLGAAYLLPATAYTNLTAACSYFSLLNWLFVLVAFVRWRQRHRGARTVPLAFGAPYGTVIAAAVIVALGVESVRTPAFRAGFWTFAVALGGIALAYLAVRGRPGPVRAA